MHGLATIIKLNKLTKVRLVNKRPKPSTAPATQESIAK